jgi:hypothetical protein
MTYSHLSADTPLLLVNAEASHSNLLLHSITLNSERFAHDCGFYFPSFRPSNSEFGNKWRAIMAVAERGWHRMIYNLKTH